ncbi:ABC transporter permease [Arenibaculum sp.]|uniref:ABC transporter permease n=1 Tax=Arenibaculum sp. TaxID=2865862 RepID=UPI002E0FBC18|nr:ABC transporter permease [Arenibaculum sp.]
MTAIPETSAAGAVPAPGSARGRRALGAGLLLAVGLLALAGPWLIDADPLRQDLRAALRGPGGGHPLGTDHLGRDMLARLAHAARLSLGLGAATVLTAAVPGVLLGLAAAWRGGAVDRALGALCASVMALPGLLLVLVLAGFAPGAFWPLYVGLALASWVEYFRVVRAVAASRLARPDVEAARLLGFGPAHVVRRHLLPDLVGPLATLMAFGLAATVVAVSSLSFVGIGLRPPTPEWGNMMTELLPYHAEAPLQLLMPGTLLFATVLGLALVCGREPS